MHRLETRPFEADDFDALAGIVARTWYGSEANGAAALMGSVDSAFCLQHSTYAMTAIADGACVGFVLARAGGADPRTGTGWERALEEAATRLRKDYPSEASRFEAYHRAEARIDADLLAASGCDGRFEIVLLVLDRSARGSGAGRTLFMEAVGYLAEQGACEVFLYTDASCNWGFYEHLGLKRRAETHPGSAAGQDILDSYYLYSYETGGRDAVAP